MFKPPRCPNDSCPQHVSPAPGFYVHNGFYRPKCRSHRVPRFACRTCGRGFSRQTFRMDYRDHRPYLTTRVYESIAGGAGVRKTARDVGLSRRCTELKYRKIAAQRAHLVHPRDPGSPESPGQEGPASPARGWTAAARSA